MIGIIGAMKVEVESLKEKMTDKKTQNISGIEFVCGTLCGKDVVCAQSGIGKVAAAICAQTMILEYGVDAIINTGVGGSLTEELGVCGMAISSGCVQHDMDTSPIGDPRGFISGIELIEIPADEHLFTTSLECAKALGIDCALGIIASGDCFVASREKKEDIRASFGAIACEMEGAAIAQVCFLNKTPYVVLRAISDSADGSAEMSYSEFVALAADASERLTLSLLEKI